MVKQPSEEEAKAAYESVKKEFDAARERWRLAQLEDELATDDLVRAQERSNKASKARSAAFNTVSEIEKKEKHAFMTLARLQMKIRGCVG